MKRTIKKINESKIELTVEVDNDLWKSAQSRAFDKVSSKVTVKGFRPGKAPKEMLRQFTNPEAVFNEAIEEILNPVFAQAVTEEKLEPFFRPSVNVTKLSPDEITIVYTFVTTPKATLGEYKGLQAKKEAPSVTDKEIEDSINNRLKANAELVLVDRPAKLGDTVVFDFLGKTANEKGDMVPFEGGASDNYSLELGSNQFVPGFEDALVGVKGGEKKTIEITFPTNYVKELAGKKAIFDCTIHEIKEKQIPSLNDEAVKDLDIKDVNTIDELKEFEKKRILEGKVREADNKYFNDIMDQIVNGTKYEIAEEVILNEAHALEEQFKKQIESNGLTFEQYLQITGAKEEDLKKNYQEQATKNIKGFLALNEIAKSEKITVTDDDLKNESEKRAADYGMKAEDILKYMNQDKERWLNMIRDQKIHEFIMSVSK